MNKCISFILCGISLNTAFKVQVSVTTNCCLTCNSFTNTLSLLLLKKNKQRSWNTTLLTAMPDYTNLWSFEEVWVFLLTLPKIWLKLLAFCFNLQWIKDADIVWKAVPFRKYFQPFWYIFASLLGIFKTEVTITKYR